MRVVIGTELLPRMTSWRFCGDYHVKTEYMPFVQENSRFINWSDFICAEIV